MLILDLKVVVCRAPNRFPAMGLKLSSLEPLADFTSILHQHTGDHAALSNLTSFK
jgi:hypothetical protein